MTRSSIALIFLLFTIGFAYSLITADYYSKRAKLGFPSVLMVCAAKDINKGQVVRSSDIELKEIDLSYSKLDYLVKKHVAVGCIAKRSKVKGQVIHQKDIYFQRSYPTANCRITY